MCGTTLRDIHKDKKGEIMKDLVKPAIVCIVGTLIPLFALSAIGIAYFVWG